MKDKLMELAEEMRISGELGTQSQREITEYFASKLDAILDAEGDGWVCVPVEPTEAMVNAWVSAEIPPIIGNDETVNRAVCTADWKAMIAASQEKGHE